MKKIEKIVKRVSKEVVTKMVAQDEGRWPPLCTSFVYQPMRPQKDTTTTDQNMNSEK